MRIVITGSPGTGKSTVSKLLARRLGLRLVSIKKIAQDGRLVGKNGEVDLKKLLGRLAFLKKEDDFIVEGHLACEFRLPADRVIILRCEPKELSRRLGKRGYSKKKLDENIMAEMLDYCLQRVEATYALRPLQIETSGRSAEDTVSEMEKAIKRNRKKIDEPDYSQDLTSYLTKGRFL